MLSSSLFSKLKQTLMEDDLVIFLKMDTAVHQVVEVLGGVLFFISCN